MVKASFVWGRNQAFPQHHAIIMMHGIRLLATEQIFPRGDKQRLAAAAQLDGRRVLVGQVLARYNAFLAAMSRQDERFGQIHA